ADWRPNRISFSVDGAVYATRRKASAPPGGWDFDRPFFLLLNLAVGGDWPQPPDASTLLPQQMSVDYVRVFSAG
ncbi:MAG: family 16 glycosylhydrolase, partial [Streptosporangiaceae bacterium]